MNENELQEFRCEELGCRKLLGMLDTQNHKLYVDSRRVNFSVELESGSVTCKNSSEHNRGLLRVYKFTEIINTKEGQ